MPAMDAMNPRPASAPPSEAVLSALAAAAGPGGVIAPEDAGPMLTEWRGRWRGRASIALAPASTAAVASVIRICAANRLGVTPQGGNTGLVGGQIPQNGEVLLSLRRLNRIRDVCPLDNTMTVEAGVTLAAAQEAAERIDRLFPLSIGSEGACQIGGVLSTNAGGVNVLRYGNARALTLGLEAVTPDGRVWNGLKRLRKDNTGYDLRHLLIGAEGTLGVITAAVLQLFPRPLESATAFVALPDAAAALRLLARAQGATGGQVSSFELISAAALDLCVRNIPGAARPLSTAAPWFVLIEIGTGRPGAAADLEAVLGAALEAGEIADAAIAASGAQAAALWRMRHALSEAMKPEGAQVKHDISVPVARTPDFIAAADRAVLGVCPGARIIAFGHLGDGNVHYDVLRPQHLSDAAFSERADAIERAVYETVDAFDGSISAEHGVGVARREEMAQRKDPTALAMMHTIKKALDPLGVMNPGKMLLAALPDPEGDVKTQ